MNTIKFHNTSLWYGEVIALNEVNFTIHPNRITGLVGSNGAGKTSSIKLAASLLKPTLGRITVDDEEIWQNYDYLKRMGYSPEIDRQFSFMTGRQFIDWSGKLHKIPLQERKQKVDDILKRVGMTHAADRKIEGYSRGMRQRVKVGQALMNDPTVLLADEPLSGTDPIGRNIMINLFKELSHDDKVTIVVSSHVLHELERISDKIIILNSGKLVAEGDVVGVRSALSKIPQKLKIVTENTAKLGPLILGLVSSLEITSHDTILVEVGNRKEFVQNMIPIAQKNNLTINEIMVLDEDLTSVFKMVKTI